MHRCTDLYYESPYIEVNSGQFDMSQERRGSTDVCSEYEGWNIWVMQKGAHT